MNESKCGNDILKCAKEKRQLHCGSKGCLFEAHCQGSQCVVLFSKTLYLLLSTGSTKEDPS